MAIVLRGPRCAPTHSSCRAAEEGWPRHQKRCREATFVRRSKPSLSRRGKRAHYRSTYCLNGMPDVHPVVLSPGDLRAILWKTTCNLLFMHRWAPWLMLVVPVILFGLVARLVDLKPQVEENFFFSSSDPQFQESK